MTAVKENGQDQDLVAAQVSDISADLILMLEAIQTDRVRYTGGSL